MKKNKVLINEEHEKVKNSKQRNCESAEWMDESRKKELLDIKKIEDTDGTIFGLEDGGEHIISLPQNSIFNKNIAVYSDDYNGISEYFIINQILQCSKRGESIIITDTMGKIYSDTSKYLKNLGYNIKVFNLVDPQYSDSWNCLNEIAKSKDQIELMTQTFCDTIVKNTPSIKLDSTFNNIEMSLLKALCLYIAMDNNRDDKDKSIETIYGLLTSCSYAQLSILFSQLPLSHPAISAWHVFAKNEENIKKNIIAILALRLHVFQSDLVRKITQFNEIDLEEPGKSKCAYYIIMPDQESTLNSLSSLFLSFLFIKLIKYADTYGIGCKCEVPVNFILNDFTNIGQISDFTKRLSTIRSRDLRVAVIFKKITELQDKYPSGLWEEIICNCDTQLFLGCTDSKTAEFISERIGQTIAKIPSIFNEETKTFAKYVLTPDEILKLNNNLALVILRGQKAFKVKKFDFKNHPLSIYLKKSSIKDYIPQ